MTRTFSKITLYKDTDAYSPANVRVNRELRSNDWADGDGLFSVNVMVDGQRIHRILGRRIRWTRR